MIKKNNSHTPVSSIDTGAVDLSNTVLAQNLRDYRTARGLAGSKISDYLDVSKSLYSYWESGKSRPSEYHLAKIAEFYNCSVESLEGPVNEEQEQVIKVLITKTKDSRIMWHKLSEKYTEELYPPDEKVRDLIINQFLQEFNTEENNEDPKKTVRVPKGGAYYASISGAPLYYFLFEKIVGLGYTSKELAIYDVSQYDPENGFYKEQPPVVITLSLVADLYNQVNTAYNNEISAYEKSKLQEALDALNKL